MKSVHLAPALLFPAAELATTVVALLGNRGSGKSNGAFVIIEGELDAGVPVIVIDYVGIYWSLRLDETGKHPSRFQIPVLGGAHGDITLVPSTGAVVADALARSHSSAVLDVSLMSKSDRCRLATDFAETFFRVKKDYPGPVHLWLEESQRFIPQKLFQGQERMLGAFEEIAEVGRNYGIGLGLISQRPQKINKDVLNLADVLIALRMNGVLERKAIAEWVQEKDADGRDAVKDELPGLERGRAIVWSPSVFDTYGQFPLKKRSTYDVNATPLTVRKAVKIKALDLAELETAMGTAVEEAKANDPRVLKARVAELERELAKKPSATPAERVKTIEREIVSKAGLLRVERLSTKLQAAEDKFCTAALKLHGDIADIRATAEMLDNTRDQLAQAQQATMSEVANLRGVLTGKANMPRTVVEPTNGITRVTTRPAFVDPGRGPRQAQIRGNEPGRRETDKPADSALSKCARALLAVIAQRERASDSQIAALSGYRRTSSTFANGMSALRTRGYFVGEPDRRVITEDGRAAAGPIEELPTGRALLDYWLGRLTKAEAGLLKVVYENGTVDRQTLSEQSQYRITSSTFANALSGIRTLDLVHGPDGGDVTIADVFKE